VAYGAVPYGAPGVVTIVPGAVVTVPGVVVTVPGAGPVIVVVVVEGMAFGAAFGASWANAANGTTARSAPAKTNLRTLNIGTSPIPKWSPAVVAPLSDAKPLTPTFDVHGEYSRRG
jgi:hypothetical protein